MIVRVELKENNLIIVDRVEMDVLQKKVYPIDDEFYNYLKDKYIGQVSTKERIYEMVWETGIHLGIWSDEIDALVKQQIGL